MKFKFEIFTDFLSLQNILSLSLCVGVMIEANIFFTARQRGSKHIFVIQSGGTILNLVLSYL